MAVTLTPWLLTASWDPILILRASPEEQHSFYYLVNLHCSVTQSCLTLWDPVDWSTPGFPVLYYLAEFVQIHVHWVDDAIQSSHPPFAHFSSSPQSFPASGSFPISHLFTSSGWSIGVSVSASVLPMNIQGQFPLELTGLISLQFNRLSKFFNTTIRKHPFFSTLPSVWSNFYILIWLLEKT